MLSSILVLALLCGGSLFIAAYFRLRFEQALPIWCMGLVLLMFVFGVCGQLALGAVLCMVLSAAAYPAVLVKLFAPAQREKNGTVLHRMFTPLFFVYGLIFVYFVVLNYGRAVTAHDEFSHWADVVKAMVTVGTLSSNPACNSQFASYPPAMALFQYFFQKVNLFLQPGAGLCEWLLFSAWQSFAAAFFMPLFRFVDLRKPYSWLLFAAAFIAPLSFFSDFYSGLLIDPFLSLVSAAGFALMLSEDKPCTWSRMFLLLCAAVLVLSKSVGLMLALFLVGAWLLWEYLAGEIHRQNWKKALLLIVAGAASIFVPWLLWKLSLSLQGAAIAFDGKVDIKVLFSALLGQDDSYRSVLVDGYYNYLISEISRFRLFDRNMTILFSFVFILFLLLVLLKLRMRAAPEKKSFYKGLFVLMAAELAVYLVGMLVTYMFKFSEYEAMLLADLERYLAIPQMLLWLTVVLGFIGTLHLLPLDKSVVAAGLLCLVLATVPSGAVRSLASRELVAQGQAYRMKYDEIYVKFCALEPDSEQSICLISQGDRGLDYQALRYVFRPHKIGIAPSWSLGEPLEGDEWTKACSPEQWWQELEDNYDYVLIYRLNDYFVENYDYLFAEPEEIRERAIYAVDREKGVLQLCQ